MFYAVLTVCLFGSALVEASTFGKCPEVQTQPKFDLSAFMGEWYEAKHYLTAPELGFKCVSVDYSLARNGTIHMITNKVVSVTDQPIAIHSLGRIPDKANPAKLKVKLAMDPVGVESDYWILGTDYTNYAVVYTCVNIKFMHYKLAWVLTRERVAGESVLEEAIQVATFNDLSEFLFRNTNQSGCY